MKKTYRRPGLMGPILLIGLGVFFLLENLDLLTWSSWESLLRLWPLLLIAWGLDLMLGRRSAWGAAIALVLILFILVGGIYLLGDSGPPLESQRSLNVPRENAEEAKIVIDPAFAYLQVDGADSASRSLLQGTISAIQGERIEQTIERSTRTVEATIRTTGVVVMPFLRFSGDQGRWQMTLDPETEFDLVVDVGAGKAELLLSDLNIDQLVVETGIGQTIVHLPERGSYKAEVKGGIGHILVYLPDDLGVKLIPDVGIGALDLPNSFRRQGDGYVSPNFEQAEATIELQVDLGIGSIEIR